LGVHRPADGRPHVTPVVAVWLNGALYFTSGPGEQKSRNLAANRNCAVTTGCNTWNEGFDVVLHGEAVIVRDLPLLQQVADTFLAKYGSDWAFEAADDGTFGGHGVSLVYQLAPVQALGSVQPHPLGLQPVIRACATRRDRAAGLRLSRPGPGRGRG
jgi:pyridoxamine 5'-phosphate oxidase-like protein